MVRGVTARTSLLFAATASTIALAAVDPRRVTDNGQATEHLTAWVLMPLGCALIALCAEDLANLRSIERPMRWMSAFIAWSFASALFGTDIAVAFAYSLAFAGVAAAALVIAHRWSWDGICVILLMAGAIHGLIASVALLMRDDVSLSGPEGLRLVSFEPNQLAREVAICLLAAAFLAWRHRGRVRLVASAALAVSAACLLATESRTALAALLVSTAILVLVRATPTTRVALIGAGFLLLSVGFATDAIDTEFDWLSRDDSGEQADIQTISGRTELWPEIIEGTDGNRIAGTGFGTVAQFMSDLRISGEIAFVATHAHNIFVHVLVTTGLVGLVLFATTIGSAFYRAIVQPHPWRDAMLVFLIIDGLAEPVIRVPAFGWAALVGIAATGVVTRRAPSTEPYPDRRPEVRSTTGS